METQCFACLNNCSIKRCVVCQCYACRGCWNKYMFENSKTFLQLEANNRRYNHIASSSAIQCPICRGTISISKHLTRSLTKYCRMAYFIILISDMEWQYRSQDEHSKITAIKDAVNLVHQNKHMFHKDIKDLLRIFVSETLSGKYRKHYTYLLDKS